MQGVYFPGDVHWARLEASALGSLCCLPHMKGRNEEATIQVLPHQTGWQYSERNPPNGGTECKGV